MAAGNHQRARAALGFTVILVPLISVACSRAAQSSEYFGKTSAPPGQVLRYVSGSEPESLDPQVSTGQPEARLYMALYEGLVEYHPRTMEPIPAIAERWESNRDLSEFVFHLRRNARWSNGDPITAHDFVYSLRRGLAPAFASRSANMAYHIKYAQAYNSQGVFVRDRRSGADVLEQDARGGAAAPAAASGASAQADALEAAVPDTPFHRFIHQPARLVLPGDERQRAAVLDADPRLKTLVAGKELVPVQATDIGVEAVDDYTLRVTLVQSAPYFLKMIAHQFFRLVPRRAVEQYGSAWTQPGHIITCGPFRLKSWKPYDEIVVERDPMYWDAARVKLDRIIFYPLEDTMTMMNLYKTGEIDALYNHTVPASWVDSIRHLKDYMDKPEAAIQYYMFNVTRPPMNDRRVRKAFNMAVDKRALAEFKRVAKPLTAFTPEGIFDGYPQPKGDEFDPAKARRLLAEAGYSDPQTGEFDPARFPVEQVELTYNTADINKPIAEFLQAQWKQNLGLTIPIRNMEWKTFLVMRNRLEYKGLARGAWGADYMDPYTFLNLFYTRDNESGTGWWDPRFDAMLDEANRTLDAHRRYELLAKAEAYLIDAQPIIPLYTNATNYFKKPYVKGLYPNAMTLHPWKFVYIEHDAAKWDHEMPEEAD